MKVLLADDSVLILERLQQMLGLFKQVEIVGAFKNGDETLQGIKILKPDLAIVDIKMPGMNGLKILNEIRKEDKSVKFMILTFFSSENYRKIAMQYGADFFFSKVDDFEKVTFVVSEMVSNEELYHKI